jgi:hypothetical protein
MVLVFWLLMLRPDWRCCPLVPKLGMCILVLAMCFRSPLCCVSVLLYYVWRGEKLESLLPGLCTLLPHLSAFGGRESMLRGRGIVCLACNRGSNGGPWFYQ